MSTPADTARTVGSLAGDPVLYLALDAADHPLRPGRRSTSTARWSGSAGAGSGGTRGSHGGGGLPPLAEA